MTHDTLYGDIAVLLDTTAGTVDISGPAVPTVTLRRTGGERAEKVPIGTRDPKHLAISVNDTPATVLPRRARLARRSFTVDVQCPDATYRLEPRTKKESRLLRNCRELGDFTSRGDGTVTADWHEDADVLPLDAALGYALAAAFGTGAAAIWRELAEEAVDMAFDVVTP